MSVTELPPIAHTRTGSAKSQRSSRGSSSGGQLTRASVVRYERPPLLSVDTSAVADTSAIMNGRTATKRSHISPGSTGSSSPSQQCTTPTQHCSPARGMSRAKSWCANEANAGPSPRLETLFEKNGISRRDLKDNSKSGHIVDKNSNIASKPPRARLRSQAGSTSNNSLMVNMRSLSNSVSNLSKISDVNTVRTARNSQTTAVQRNKSALIKSQKFKSEQNLTTLGNNRPQRLDQRVTQVTNRSAHPQNARNNNNLKPTHSNPLLNKMDTQSADQSLTTLNIKNMKNLDDRADDESDSDSERDTRIRDWLFGLETAEHPAAPSIIEEPPRQTDTAIHIVYDKD